SAIRARAQKTTLLRSAASVLTEKVHKQDASASHDVFLSHAFDDRDLLMGTALSIEDLGYSVYIDWRDDPTLDRKHVTASTAAKLRQRMNSSRCLFYAVTPASADSTWMKW